MSVRRIAPVIAGEPAAARAFYGDVLGLAPVMDHGWILTFASADVPAAQVSVAREGGSGAPVPDLSVEVDDLDGVLARVRAARVPVVYGPATEPWGVRRFFVEGPFGRIINILSDVTPQGSAAPPSP
jgi:catechol 2,3-dioxygenase-like lactoylglutathione lyase family enzyme